MRAQAGQGRPQRMRRMRGEGALAPQLLCEPLPQALERAIDRFQFEPRDAATVARRAPIDCCHVGGESRHRLHFTADPPRQHEGRNDAQQQHRTRRLEAACDWA